MEHTIDATNEKLGRLASRVASILQGKLNADYEPRLAGKDRVIIKNIQKMAVTGKKIGQKLYRRHTGYMGHLKKRTYGEFFAKSPSEVFRTAVKRMLPHNRLLEPRLQRLVIEK